jgi:hypothetical protein
MSHKRPGATARRERQERADEREEARIDAANEPDDDAITTEDHRTFYQYGKVVFVLDEEEDVEAGIARELDRLNFWPDVFFISDHGNAHLIHYSEGA